MSDLEADAEARVLIRELEVVQHSLPSGSAERESKEDQIFKRLTELAKQIQYSPNRTKTMVSTYESITNQSIPEQELISTEALPIYTDPLFTRYPEKQRMKTFCKHLTTHHKDFKRPVTDIDDPKIVLQSFTRYPKRDEIWKTYAEHTCKTCWRDIMYNMFFMLSEVLVVELHNRSKQVVEMLDANDLSLEGARDVVNCLDQSIVSLKKLIKSVSKNGESNEKQYWVDVIEELFKLNTVCINNIMMNHMILVKNREAIDRGDLDDLV